MILPFSVKERSAYVFLLGIGVIPNVNANAEGVC